VAARLEEQALLAGLPLGRFYPELGDALLVCVTEMNPLAEITRLASALAGSGKA